MSATVPDTIHILHADDSREYRELTAELLERENDRFAVETVPGADDALERVEADPPDCIVSDYNMPGTDGIEFCRRIREAHPDLPFILCTGMGSETVASEAISAGTTDYFAKEQLHREPELLANRIANTVSAHRTAQRAERQAALMDLTQHFGDTGGWELHVEADELRVTDGTRRVLGLTATDPLSAATLLDRFHPDDRPAIRAALDTAATDAESSHGTWRLPATGEDPRFVEMSIVRVITDDETTTLRGAVQDVTERERRTRELEAERRFVDQALDSLDDLFYVVGADGTLQRWNSCVSELTGYSDAELADMQVTELFPEPHRGAVADSITEAVATGQSKGTTDLLSADGRRIPCEFVGSRLTDPDRAGTRVVGIGRDLREQRKRERQFRALVEQSTDLISITDPDGRFLYQSPAIERLLGYTPTETVGDSIFEYVHPDDRETVRRQFEQWVSAPETTPVMKYRARHADGSWRWIESRGNNQQDNPIVEGYIINSRDVTEREDRAAELRRKSRAIDEAPVGIVISDPEREDNPMIYANQHFVDLTGYPLGELLGRNCRFLQGEATAPEPVAALRSAIDAEEAVSVELRNYRRDGSPFWNQLKISPVRDETGSVVNYVGFQIDGTERIERERALEKRERILRELHTATRAFYPPESPGDIAAFLVEFVERAFGFGYVSVKQYDPDRGLLTPVASSWGTDGNPAIGPVEPGDTPIWEAYQRGESAIFDGQQLADIETPAGDPVEQALVVPIGEFGATVALDTDGEGFDQVDLELIEVVAANAEAAFRRLRSDRERTAVTDELSEVQSEMDDLNSVIEVLRTIQNRLATSESQAALETAVCEELVDTARIDFAWIGRPQGRDTDLTPAAWAGDGEPYLGTIETPPEMPSLPAHHAAARRQPTTVPTVSERVLDEPWAKEALSAGFGSVLAVPLVYDDVLYGTVTVYSRESGAFDPIYEDLVTNVASLLVNYSRILEQRYSDSTTEYIEREFELRGPTYPLQRLAAATDSQLRFDTVAEHTDDTVRVLVTVVDGSAEAVVADATRINSIAAAEPFGDSGAGQLSLTVTKPFLASVVGKHGGTLVGSLSTPSRTTFRVSVPTTVSHRPLVDALQSRYAEIQLLSQQHTQRPHTTDGTVAAELLTDRQHEILRAAYHGGYYETPRQVTGEELAESFGITSPTVYNHLQAAHRTVLRSVFEP